MSSEGPVGDEQQLHELFDDHANQVYRYALRHVDASTAHDIVSDVFLVVWQRLRDVPVEPLRWLLVIARNSVRNRTRSSNRRRRTAAEFAALATTTADWASSAADVVIERQILLAALASLSLDQREALLLVSWDGLTTSQAAHVAGCTTTALKVRLHRGRTRLREALTAADERPDSHRPPGPEAQAAPRVAKFESQIATEVQW